jgi:hypothetical protein
MSFFSTIGQRLAALFMGIGSDVLAAVEAFANAIVAGGGSVLIQAAADAVATAETTGGTGSVKLAAAQAAVISDLTSKGIPVVQNAVNAAIEAAVAQMKANPNAASPASPPTTSAS